MRTEIGSEAETISRVSPQVISLGWRLLIWLELFTVTVALFLCSALNVVPPHIYTEEIACSVPLLQRAPFVSCKLCWCYHSRESLTAYRPILAEGCLTMQSRTLLIVFCVFGDACYGGTVTNYNTHNLIV